MEKEMRKAICLISLAKPEADLIRRLQPEDYIAS